MDAQAQVCIFVVHKVFLHRGPAAGHMSTPKTGFLSTKPIWASSRENLSSGVGEQHRRRPACASAV